MSKFGQNSTWSLQAFDRKWWRSCIAAERSQKCCCWAGRIHGRFSSESFLAENLEDLCFAFRLKGPVILSWHTDFPNPAGLVACHQIALLKAMVKWSHLVRDYPVANTGSSVGKTNNELGFDFLWLVCESCSLWDGLVWDGLVWDHLETQKKNSVWNREFVYLQKNIEQQSATIL